MDANVGRHDLGKGVYYALRDYAGFARRMAIIIIDFGVIMLAGILIVIAWTVLWSDEPGFASVTSGWPLPTST